MFEGVGDNMSKWIDVSKVIEVVEKAKNRKWNWGFNSRCKYINIRIDMRDGHCLLFDRDDNPITLDDLNYQCSTIEGMNA